MKYLIISDLHYPERARYNLNHIIPIIQKENFDKLVCLGDYGEKGYEIIREKFKNTICIKGNGDILDLPEFYREKAGSKNICFIHGHQAGRGDLNILYRIARIKGCDILFFGHTHIPLVIQYNDIILANPGTLTGAKTVSNMFPKGSYLIYDSKNYSFKIKFVE